MMNMFYSIVALSRYNLFWYKMLNGLRRPIRLIVSFCVAPAEMSWDSRGKYISPRTPISSLMRRAQGRGLFPSRSRQGGCAREASLRCVRPHHFRSLLLCLRQRSPLTSAPRRIPRFSAGRQCLPLFHIFIIIRSPSRARFSGGGPSPSRRSSIRAAKRSYRGVRPAAESSSSGKCAARI